MSGKTIAMPVKNGGIHLGDFNYLEENHYNIIRSNQNNA
jgi:hypothetical protein